MRTLPTLGLAALFALPLAAPASAQASAGVKAGLSVATLSGDEADGLDPRLGFTGGLQLRYDVNPSFALQAEALYAQKGAEDGDDFADPGTYRLDYIEVPVLARFAIPVSRYADAGIYAGPAFAFPISGEFRSDTDAALDIDYDDDLKTDIGGAIGVDYYSGPIGIDLRFTTGLQDVFEDGRGFDARNQAFTVSLGYRFGGGTAGRGRRY